MISCLADDGRRAGGCRAKEVRTAAFFGGSCEATNYFMAASLYWTSRWRKGYQMLMNALPPCYILATVHVYVVFGVLAVAVLLISGIKYVTSFVHYIFTGVADDEGGTGVVRRDPVFGAALWWRAHCRSKIDMRMTAIAVLDLAVALLIYVNSWIWHVTITGPQESVRDADIADSSIAAWANGDVRVESLRGLAEGISGGGTGSSGYGNGAAKWRLPSAPSLIVSNHLSNLDGFVAKAALYPMRCAAVITSQATVFPFVGSVLKLTKQPLVYFTDAHGGWGTTRKAETLESCELAVKSNFPLLVYPEGARNRTNRPQDIQPLRRGILKFAIQREMPIIITAIYGSQNAWPVGSAFVSFADVHFDISDKFIIPNKHNDVQDISNVIKLILTDMLNKRSNSPN